MIVQGGHAIQPLLRLGNSRNVRMAVKGGGICRGERPNIETMLSTGLHTCALVSVSGTQIRQLIRSAYYIPVQSPQMKKSMIGIGVISKSCNSYE